jgi:5-methylcytosine-specific restriction endonuclease McrA
MNVSIALHSLTKEQEAEIDNAAIFGTDFDNEIDDLSEADIAFFWVDWRRCDEERPFLAVTMLDIGYAVARNGTVWVCADTDLSKHEALWPLDTMIEMLPAFASPAEALETLTRRYLHTMPYREYLQTTHWDMTRYFMLRRAGERCQLCNTTKKPLHVHHRTYERRGFEEPGDLIVLCAGCHATFHHKLPKGGE